MEADERIDLLITDVGMPSDRVNGLARSRMARMRQLDLRVIYVSGYDIPGFEDQALATLLRKPVSHELAPRLNRVGTFDLVARSDEI